MVTSIAELYTPEGLAQATAQRTVHIHLSQQPEAPPRKRVAAYCRVSTDKEEQLGSLANQMAAFRHQVSLHPDWELVRVYSDAGKSGTSVRGRQAFQEMIADSKAGQIDYILVKSISRFARNTLDCIRLVRELQGCGVQLYFEKENIDTSDIASEMLLVIMASFAQEESRSISENVKWGIRKRYESGKEIRVLIYGYRHTQTQLYQIEPEEAAIVREIFTRYAHGETPKHLVEDLNARRVPPPAGTCWKLLQISRMLHNEKYVGDVVLQKHYVESHLTHKEVRNTGQVPLVHIQNAHTPLIDRHLFVQVQQILAMRQVKTQNSSYPYGNLLRCPHCGRTLVHGSLYSLPFAGTRVHNGGWGCYAEGGCGQYLLIQNVLDEALICAYWEKFRIRQPTAEFYWIDDALSKIVLQGDHTLVLHWRDGAVSTAPLPIPHPQLVPEASAARYNQFLEKVCTGKTKVKSKFLMGLREVAL